MRATTVMVLLFAARWSSSLVPPRNRGLHAPFWTSCIGARRSLGKGAAAGGGSLSPGKEVSQAEFLRHYSIILELRRDRSAVVDRLGAAAIYERALQQQQQQEVEGAAAANAAFQTLVALMLSSQTKDTVTFETISRLNERLNGTLSLEGLRALPDEDLNKAIGKVGFHRRKTEYLKRTCEVLRDQHGGLVPDTMEDLLSLPGVGPKMAILCLQIVFGRVAGVSVDTHVHRISNALGWCDTNTPDQTRRALEKLVPRDYWRELNPVVVGLGQEAQVTNPRGYRTKPAWPHFLSCAACSPQPSFRHPAALLLPSC